MTETAKQSLLVYLNFENLPFTWGDQAISVEV